MSRLLAGVNRLHAAAAQRRADVLAEQVAAVLRAEAAAVDFVPPDGRPLRLAAAGRAGRPAGEQADSVDAAGLPGMPFSAVVAAPFADPVGLSSDGPPAGPDEDTVPRVTLLPPTGDGPAVIRSVYRHEGVASSLVGWRADPFDAGHAALLRLLHPAVAWAIAPAPATPAPPPLPPPPPGVAGVVLELLLAGLPEKEIARRLERSDHTIHAHVKRVYKHFGVRSRPQLILTLGVAGHAVLPRAAALEPNDAERVD